MYVNQGCLCNAHSDGGETYHWRNSFCTALSPRNNQLRKTAWVSRFCWFFKDIQSLNVDVAVEGRIRLCFSSYLTCQKTVQCLMDKPVSRLDLFGILIFWIWKSFWLKTNFFTFKCWLCPSKHIWELGQTTDNEGSCEVTAHLMPVESVTLP